MNESVDPNGLAMFILIFGFLWSLLFEEETEGGSGQ